MPFPAFAAVAPVLAAGLSAAGGIAASALSVREARKNREFQERMSNTSHQREVRDLRAAGINPSIRSMSGASTPSGDRAEISNPVPEAVASALAVKRAQAEIDLLKSQDLKTRMEAREIEQAQPRRLDLLNQQIDLGAMTNEQMREMVPLAIQRAREEIGLTAASAQAARARALLDEYAATGAFNEAQFEKWIGTKGPATKFLLNLVRSLKK